MNQLAGKIILLRADASPEIGNGHVLRLLALGQAWINSGGSALLLSRQCPSSLLSRFADEGIKTFTLGNTISSEEDSFQTSKLADEHNVHCVAIDGYGFDSRYQSRIRHPGRILLVLDDYHHLDRYDADLIVNQNLGATAGDYQSLATNSLILAGSQYTLLRREFVSTPFEKKEIRTFESTYKPVRLLVTLGGADPDNASGKVLQGVLQLREILKKNSNLISLSVRLLIGSSNSNREHLQNLTREFPQVEVFSDVSNMVEQYQWADIAIVAGGSTNWELSMFGIPRIVLVLAENQQQIAKALELAGVAFNLGEQGSITPDHISESLLKLISDESLRKSMSVKSHQLIDGKGATRVLDVLSQMIDAKKR